MFFVVFDGAINNRYVKELQKDIQKTENAKDITNTIQLFHPLIILNIRSNNQFQNTESEFSRNLFVYLSMLFSLKNISEFA